MKKSGFTLMEVNLAVFIMALGVLTMVVLYPLGFREGQQSREDMAAADMADSVFNPLVAALSSTNVTWSQWKKICGGDGVLPDNDGWLAYCSNPKNNAATFRPKSRSELSSMAKNVIKEICSAYRGPGNPESDISRALSAMSEMGYALVASTPYVLSYEDQKPIWYRDYSRIALSFRATHRHAQLFSQPIFYTEVHFQGDPEK